MIDVCLVLEGTYPYVAGGVSTWVHQLISAMKDLRFGIIYIAPHADPTRTLKYDLPPQVLLMKEIYLHDYVFQTRRKRRPRRADFERIRLFYEDVICGRFERFPEIVRLFRGERSCLDTATALFSKETWDILVGFYARMALSISFLDYFWTWRGTHLPILEILQAEIPQAKVYHAVSTGYAGLIGAIAKVSSGSKFFLTEHGIYTHERMLEISQANWIFEEEKRHYRAESELSFFKKWWITLFEVMSRITYRSADRIFTLYEGNKVRQVLEGADPEKITIIPNGIDVEAFASLKRETKDRPQIGLVGRVVTIKDIKTFVYAARLVLREVPETQFFVLGPTDEEEDYFNECRGLVETLGLEDRFVFTGRVDVKQYYPFLDVVVLTSLSEAQPYVILEVGALGIPVVATDVGACREMLEGRGPEDRALGPSGLVTDVASPEATAEATLKLIRDPHLARRLGAVGVERVRRYYDQDDLLARYMNIYEQSL